MPNFRIERRFFIKSSAAVAGGLILGFWLPSKSSAQESNPHSGTFDINGWLQIETDGTITIFLGKSEMGQGVYTTLPSLIAEELEADWNHVRIKEAPSVELAEKFGKATGGSTSVRRSYDGLRQAGAIARMMLVTAAAKSWNVAPETCLARDSSVIHKESGRKVSFGEIAERASKVVLSSNPPLKKSSEFRLIGKPLQRLDTPAKVNGSAVFGIDVRLPNMVFAAAKMAPLLDGEVENLPELKKKAKKGVRIEGIPNGVAAIANSFWLANQELNRLKIKFGRRRLSTLNSTQISRSLLDALKQEGKLVESKKSASPELDEQSTKRVVATYEVPFLAHATMEPMNCTASLKGNVCEIWTGTQSPSLCKQLVAKALQIPVANVVVHTTFLGGGFGRRLEQDFAVQAALLTKAVQRPVQLIWSREEDIQHDFYRPAFAARLEARLSNTGELISWNGINAGPSILERRAPERLADAKGIDPHSVDGFKSLPYAIANTEIRTQIVATTVPVGFWRSVGFSQNSFFVESFIDELAASAGTDPIEFRRSLLKNKPRHLAVLNTVAEKSNWRSPSPTGTAKGIALVESFGTIVAQVVQASYKDEKIKVHRAWCAYDCGPIVNPDNIEAQMQSGIIFGLNAALWGEITVKDGKIEQENFDSYRLLRLSETPPIEIFRCASEATMGGIGEPGTPPVAPALANAIFSLTGKRIRKLPLEKRLKEMSSSSQ